MTADIHSEISLLDVRNRWWHRGDLEYKLDALQQEISATVRARAAKKVCILSSRQIGKSYWAVAFGVEYLLRNPGKIVRILAPTLKAVNDIVNDNLNAIIRDAPVGLITPFPSKLRWEFANGSSLRLGALERAHVDNNRGGNASVCIFEEAGFVSSDDFIYAVNSVIGPQLLRSNGYEIFVSSPSEDPDHALHTVVKPECEGLGTFFKYTVYDSPSITPPQIEEAIRRCGGKQTDAFRREYMAEIIRPSSLMVVPDYVDKVPLVCDFDDPIKCWWSVTTDWGGVRDLTVSLLHTYDFIANKDLVRAEKVFAANTPTSVIVDSLREWDTYNPERWADVQGQTAVDLASLGYVITLPQKSDWLATCQAMAVKFTTQQIIIDPACTFLRKSLRAGMFNKNRTDYERSEALGHCDALAALAYAIRSQNRTNPYVGSYQNGYLMTREADPGEVQLAKAMAPKGFGSFRK